MTQLILRPNNFFSIFDEVDNLMFNRPFKDMNPIKWSKTDEGYLGYAITTGIKPEDVTVTPDDGYIKLKGYTKDEETGEEYSQSFEVKVNPDIYKNIEEVTYTSKDGVTKINIKVTKQDSKIKVKRI